MKKKVMVVGAGGQLGQELQRTVAADMECVPMTRAQLDIADAAIIDQRLAAITPQIVVNAAAYTAVDNAESEPEAARRCNAVGPGILAEACATQGIRLIHISTDFVFDGTSSKPYQPGAATAPLGEYGRSKRDGELAVQKAQPQALILRTGWLYSSYGNNFVKTMLRLMRERDVVSVVTDQIGTPTWAHGLAEAIWAAAARPQLSGIYHWSDAGVCSWYDFAVAIYEESHSIGLISRPVEIRPIPTTEYPTPAQRPAYSVLDKARSWRDFAVEGIHWRGQLRTMLAELKERENG